MEGLWTATDEMGWVKRGRRGMDRRVGRCDDDDEDELRWKGPG